MRACYPVRQARRPVNNRLGLAEIELKIAFRQAGCPICRLKRQGADRYIFGLLWENVNDMTTRIHLARSLGFCPQHTWQLYRTEMEQFGNGLGSSIIYEDLTRLVVSGLRDFQARLPASSPPRLRWWQRGWAWWQKALGRAAPIVQPAGITPAEACRVCVHSAGAEARDIQWLVEGCADAVFRKQYAASDGLCLPHLQQALTRAAQAHPAAARFLAETAVARLETLAVDLGEYARKHAWQYRHERMTDAEKDSPRRASSFFGGPDERER